MDDKYFGWFGDKKHKFYIGMRCGKSVIPNTQLCGRCHERPKENHKYQAKPLHGLVTETLPPWSHIFGGEWYQAKVAEYGLPSEEEMARARKAHQAVIDSLTTNIVMSPSPTPLPLLVAALEPIQKPLEGKKKDEVVMPSPSVSVKSEEKPKRPYKRRQPTAIASTVLPSKDVTTLAIETNEPVQCDLEFVKRVVKKMIHEGKTYYLESSTQKIYSAGADGRPLSYIGRWNARNQTIHTDISDSEEEN